MSDATGTSDIRSRLVDQKPWWKNTMAIIGLVTALTAAAAGLYKLQQSVFAKDPPAQYARNTEIILDTSEEMQDGFGNAATKWLSAVAVLNSVLRTRVSDDHNLALRQAGGPCDGEQSRLVVNFGADNKKKVGKSLAKVQLGGTPTLVNAVVEAVGDLSDPRRFEGRTREIIVITGGGEACHRRAIEDIRASLGDTKGLEVEFHIVGMGVSPDQARNLDALAREFNGRAYYANSPDQLEKIVTWLVEVNPVLSDVNQLVVLNNAAIGHLNQINNDVIRNNYQAAEAKRDAAAAELKRSAPLLKDLEDRQSRDEFRSLYQLVSENRSLLERVLPVADRMIDTAKQKDDKSHNDAIKEWNSIIAAHNTNVTKVREIQAGLELSLK